MKSKHKFLCKEKKCIKIKWERIKPIITIAVAETNDIAVVLFSSLGCASVTT